MDAASGEAGASCSFNRECLASERCECSESNGCRCATGPRGAGALGASCTNGNDCASSLCVEGPMGFVCSDECSSNAQCSGVLPRCVSVATLGMICARLPPDAGANTDASSGDASASDGGASSTLVATFGARTGPFDRAQHGLAGTDQVYIEAHFGGSPACPSMTSPTPDRTLVISNIHANGSMSVQTYADGVRATLLDFRSTFTSTLPLRATDVRVTPREVTRGLSVSYDFSATFPGGTIAGTFTAPHCASLDE